VKQRLTKKERDTIARAEKGFSDYEEGIIAIDWDRAKNIRIQASHSFYDQSGNPQVEQFDSSVLDFWNNQLQSYRDRRRRGTVAAKFFAAENFLYAFDTVKNDGLWIDGQVTKKLLEAKEKEIADLRGLIASKDTRLGDLETELNTCYSRVRFLEETLRKNNIAFGTEKGSVV
jgi:hypothetical protein